MDHISIEKLKELAQVQEPCCISIFMPTHKAGQEVNEGLDPKNLKNHIKSIHQKLKAYPLKKEKEIEEIIDPLHRLLEDTLFWKHQSDGLAIFRNRKQFDVYTLPLPFDPFIYVNDHFYPMPLIPYINDDCRFYLLCLSLGNIKMYEGFPHQIKELEVKELLPEKLEEVVGYDYREKNLQFRTGQTGREQTMFHGHGKGKEDAQTEILKFFKAVNNGVMKIVHDKKIPLVVATVDHLMPLYQKTNDYKYLYDGFIAGNPENEPPEVLHKKARALLKNYSNQEKDEKLTAFKQMLSSHKASSIEDEIISAAINQRVDTLFVRKREELWGSYDNENNRVLKPDKTHGHGSCLLNMTAMNVILNNGKVFLTEPEDMPEPATKLNAIFRF